MVLQVGLDLLDQLGLVWAVGVEPEHGGHARVARAGDGQLDPVADRGVLDLAHAPDVAGFDVLAQQHFASGDVDDVGHAVLGDLEGLVVRAVFLGLLRHQTDVGHGAHGGRVEVAVGLAEVDDLLVDAGKGRLGDDGLGVLGLAVGIPHLAADADHGRHRGVDDHVVGRVQVGDALGRVDHGQLGTVLVAGVQVADDLFTLGGRQGRDLVVQVDHAVVDVDAELVEQLAVLLERFLVEDLDGVAEHDRVRDLHHGGLDVQRQHHAGLARVLELLFVEGAQGLLAHEHAVDDLAFEQLGQRLEHDGLAAVGDQLHADFARAVQRQRLLAMVEVAVLHVRDVGARSHAPLAHAVRVLAGVVLDRQRGTAVGVAFAQHRVDGRAQAFAVAGADRLLGVGLGIFREVGQVEALGLQFLDRADELVHRGADVGQLDDVGIRLQRLLAQLGQGVGTLLHLAEVLGELAQDTTGDRDVGLGHFDAGRRGEGAHDRQEGGRCQARGLVCQRVDDLGFVRHCVLLRVRALRQERLWNVPIQMVRQRQGLRGRSQPEILAINPDASCLASYIRVPGSDFLPGIHALRRGRGQPGL